MINRKPILLYFSLFFNALFIFFILFSIFRNSSVSSLTFYNAGKANQSTMTAALITNSPAHSPIVYNAVEITLRPGEEAFLQFSGMIGTNQVNWIIEALYDRGVINVQKNAWGIVITAIQPGECVIQTLSNDGIRDFAFVRVTN